ncbi:pilus assembly protein TadG-related protein, partial [Ketobacter sp.]
MYRRNKFLTSSTQHGQALVLAIALFAVAGVMFFLMFNSGRAVNEKINLVNAADSAAYSGA